MRALRSKIRTLSGVLAQLVERLNGIEEVRGSNPLGSKDFDSKFWSIGDENAVRLVGRVTREG